MLDISMALMRTLIDSDTSVISQPTVVVSTVDSVFENTLNNKMAFFNGRQIPERLMSWAKSDIRSDTVRRWFTDESDVNFEYNKKNKAYSFYMKQKDRKRGLYSGYYKTLDEAADDLFVLCDVLAGADIQTINYKIMQIREQFTSENCC